MNPVNADDPRRIFERVPFTRLLEMRREHAEGGRARFAIEARAELGNVVGSVHGGVIATLVDVAMASAAVSRVDFALTVVTLDLNTSFLGAGHGRLVAEAECLHAESGVAWCSATVTDAHGQRVARSQGSFRYRPLPKPGPDSGAPG